MMLTIKEHLVLQISGCALKSIREDVLGVPPTATARLEGTQEVVCSVVAPTGGDPFPERPG